MIPAAFYGPWRNDTRTISCPGASPHTPSSLFLQLADFLDLHEWPPST